MLLGGSPEAPVVGVPVMAARPDPAFAPAVTFGDGRRPETRTQVQLAEFDGPLGLLLSLIEARQLDVLTVPLGALADAYLDALGRLEADRLGNVSSFVAIASQLILIKSRAMLPRQPQAVDPTAVFEENADPEAELRARLLLYRAHRDAGLRLAQEAIRRVGPIRSTGFVTMPSLLVASSGISRTVRSAGSIGLRAGMALAATTTETFCNSA